MAFRPTSGRSAADALAVITRARRSLNALDVAGRVARARRLARTAVPAALLAAIAAGCYGFSGGGFPGHIRTVYIEPFENRTDRFELDQSLSRQLTDKLPGSLGLRLAGQEVADAIIRGRLLRYTDQAQNYQTGAQGNINVLLHKVQITVAVEMVDRTRNEIVWESQGVTGIGEYRPDTQNVDVAQAVALESVVQQIVDGAQSNW